MPAETIVHIIDDDDAVRDSLAFLLSSSGIRAETHASAVVFLERFAEASIGCIITDIRMPDISGIDLLRQVKERNPALPVIVITGHGDVPLAVEAMKLGAADFLEKPFDDDALLAAIRTARPRARARRAGRTGRRIQEPSRLAVDPRARGARRPGRRPSQQDHRLRPRHQPEDGRGLPCQRHDQDEGLDPVGSRPHGAGHRLRAERAAGCFLKINSAD
jgi:two-component system response regulator FixJ